MAEGYITIGTNSAKIEDIKPKLIFLELSYHISVSTGRIEIPRECIPPIDDVDEIYKKLEKSLIGHDVNIEVVYV